MVLTKNKTMLKDLIIAFDGIPFTNFSTNRELSDYLKEKETVKLNAIRNNDEVGAIGGIKEKIFTANNKVELFFCPKENYQAALEAYQMLKKPSYQLKMVESFSEALDFLKAYEK